ncbi:hypothetical protein BU15DRAFT_81497 [Melanogaster broomeanus]|nr:hypothetical protein BU15DRAFT_81497 [Melanogaster broomeanus]
MASLIMSVMQGPFCGTLATLMLYGVICMQIFHYARNYGTDRKAIKWLVGCLWILETVHTVFSIHFVEFYLILNYDNPLALDYVIWQVLLRHFCSSHFDFGVPGYRSIGATYIIGFLVAWIVDIFFVWRIWQLSKQNWICVFLAMLATVRTGLGIGNCTVGFRYTAVNEFLSKVHPTMIAGWTIAAFADTLIALTLCYYLRKHRSGMKRTEHIINRLLFYIINTGVLTSFFAILVVTMFLALQTSMVFTAFVQVQIYAISLLASLNSRKDALEEARRVVPTMNNVSLPLMAKSGPEVGRLTLPPIEITKNVKTDVHRDEESSQASRGARLA